MYEIRNDSPTENSQAAGDEEPAGSRKRREPRARLLESCAMHGESAAINKKHCQLQHEPMRYGICTADFERNDDDAARPGFTTVRSLGTEGGILASRAVAIPTTMYPC